MRLSAFIFLLFPVLLKCQDKLFFKNGESKKGIIVSMGNDFVFFKHSDSAVVNHKIPKTDLLMIEKYDGKIYIFSNPQVKDSSNNAIKKYYRNTLSLQPFNFLLGRITANYEYLNKSGKIGIVIPLSLTFDPIGTIYNIRGDSSKRKTFSVHQKGINFIGGTDINFYLGKGDFEGFFIGPRIRYGTDMFLSGIEAYSLQTQFGWKLSEHPDRLSQHFSVGFGFVRILASPAGTRISSKQAYGWFSINYRIGICW